MQADPFLLACTVDRPGVHEAVACLLRTLGLDPVAGSTLSQQLAAAKQALSEQVLPVLKDSQRQRQEQQSSDGNGAAVVQPASFPLGFSTGGEPFTHLASLACMQRYGSGVDTRTGGWPFGHVTLGDTDEKVDIAATIMRMLLIKDLRSLQTQIDDMIVQVQVSIQALLSVHLG